MGVPITSFKTYSSLASQEQFVRNLLSQREARSPLTRVLARIVTKRLDDYSRLWRDAGPEHARRREEEDRLDRLCKAYKRAVELENRYGGELPALQDLHFERYLYLYGEYLLLEEPAARDTPPPCDHSHKRAWLGRFCDTTEDIGALYELLLQGRPSSSSSSSSSASSPSSSAASTTSAGGSDALRDYVFWDLGDPNIIGELITVGTARQDLEAMAVRFPREQRHMIPAFRYAIGHCLEHEFDGHYLDPTSVGEPSDESYERLILGDAASAAATEGSLTTTASGCGRTPV